jgi:hypothetical protein
MKIKELLSSPEKWTQGVSARDKNGDIVYATCATATCFCLMGAIEHCYRNENEAELIYKKIRTKVISHISIWNDQSYRTFEDVKQLVEELDI